MCTKETFRSTCSTKYIDSIGPIFYIKVGISHMALTPVGKGVRGSTGPWVLGSLGPWYLGSLGPWVLGTLGPWDLQGQSAPMKPSGSMCTKETIRSTCSTKYPNSIGPIFYIKVGISHMALTPVGKEVHGSLVPALLGQRAARNTPDSIGPIFYIKVVFVSFNPEIYLKECIHKNIDKSLRCIFASVVNTQPILSPTLKGICFVSFVVGVLMQLRQLWPCGKSFFLRLTSHLSVCVESRLLQH